jgi:NAD(P)H-hydrate epimerase
MTLGCRGAGKAVTVKQIQNLDRLAIEKTGIPSVVLMENAGRAVAQGVIKELGKRDKRPVVVLCGPGNNGGDGFVAARHLLNAGIALNVFLIGREKDLKSDTRLNYDILKRLRQPVLEISAVNQSLRKSILNSSVVVDAIFGVGLNRDITGWLKDVIEAVNASVKGVIAVDIPSGLNGTTGKIIVADIGIPLPLLLRI